MIWRVFLLLLTQTPWILEVMSQTPQPCFSTVYDFLILTTVSVLSHKINWIHYEFYLSVLIYIQSPLHSSFSCQRLWCPAGFQLLALEISVLQFLMWVIVNKLLTLLPTSFRSFNTVSVACAVCVCLAWGKPSWLTGQAAESGPVIPEVEGLHWGSTCLLPLIIISLCLLRCGFPRGMFYTSH